MGDSWCFSAESEPKSAVILTRVLQWIISPYQPGQMTPYLVHIYGPIQLRQSLRQIKYCVVHMGCLSSSDPYLAHHLPCFLGRHEFQIWCRYVNQSQAISGPEKVISQSDKVRARQILYGAYPFLVHIQLDLPNFLYLARYGKMYCTYGPDTV